ncbi:MAG: holo-ACP synthase [Alphaproteobacteria bacterium]|nr:holo-ACP synthase [Alphaproteobacteria bacterium]
MILGIGTDMVDKHRILRLLEAFPERFPAKILTPAEREAMKRRPQASRASFLAKRYAAKEACLKALGTGLAAGLSWQEMEIGSTEAGAPTLTLSGEALSAARKKAGGEVALHLSLTDEAAHALAFVVITPVAPGAR